MDIENIENPGSFKDRYNNFWDELCSILDPVYDAIGSGCHDLCSFAYSKLTSNKYWMGRKFKLVGDSLIKVANAITLVVAGIFALITIVAVDLCIILERKFSISPEVSMSIMFAVPVIGYYLLKKMVS